MKQIQNLILAALLAWPALPVLGATRKDKEPAAPGPVAFAPLPAGHDLAAIWNDPDFARRLMNSYGIAAEAEPRLNGEELQYYTNKITPRLQENRRKAIPLLEERVKQPGSSAQFDYLLGTLHFEHEDLTNAVKSFESALVKSRDFRRAQKSLGLALVRSDRYDEAVKALVRTISLGGGDSAVYGVLGYAYMSLNRFASAEGAYKQALVFEPEKKEFKLGLVKCAVASANYDYALALLDELLRLYPGQDALWSLQANIYLQKDQPAKAAISLELLRRLGKADAKNLFLLGDLYMNQDARDLALETYLAAIEKDEGRNPVRALRPAGILVSRGAWEEARILFAKIRGTAVKLEGEDDLKLLKLESKVAMSTGKGEQAITTLEAIKARNPLDGEALLLAGEYYARHGQPELAANRFIDAAKLEGFAPDAYVKHAQLLVQSKKYAEAAELLRKAQKARSRDNVQRYLEKVEQLARAGRS